MRILNSVVDGRSGMTAVANTLSLRMLTLFFNLFTSVIAARSLGPTGRGISLAVLVWPFILATVGQLGIASSFTYHARRNISERDRLFTTSLVLVASVGSLTAVLAAVFIIPSFLHNYSRQTQIFGQILLIIVPQIMVFNLVQAFFDVGDRFARSNTIVAMNTAATLVLQIILLLTHRMGPYANALAYMTPTALYTVYVVITLRKHLDFAKGFRARASLLLNYGVRVAGTDLLTTVSGQVDQTLVLGLLSATSFGLYAVALNLTRLLNVLQNSINIVLFPKASSLEPSEAIPLIKRVARVSLAISFVSAITFTICIPVVVPLLYGPAYTSIVIITRVLTAEAFIQGGLIVLSQAFMATGRPGVMTSLQLCGVSTSIPLMFVLVPRYGLIGAACALLTSSIVRAALLLISFPLVLKSAIPGLLLKRSDIQLLRQRLRPAISKS